MIGALLLAVQAAPAAPERFSILVPVPDERCTRKGADGADVIVVCGDPLPSQTLPYPDEIVPRGPVPSNPNLSAAAALRAEATPCAAMQKGCTVGFGPPIAPIVAGAVGLVKDALRKKPSAAERRQRVAIPLDDATPLPLPLPR